MATFYAKIHYQNTITDSRDSGSRTRRLLDSKNIFTNRILNTHQRFNVFSSKITIFAKTLGLSKRCGVNLLSNNALKTSIGEKNRHPSNNHVTRIFLPIFIFVLKIAFYFCADLSTLERLTIAMS